MKEAKDREGAGSCRVSHAHAKAKGRGKAGALVLGCALALSLAPSIAFAEEDASNDGFELASDMAAQGDGNASALASGTTKTIDGVTYTYQRCSGKESEARYGVGVYILSMDIASDATVVIPKQIDGMDVVSCEALGSAFEWDGDNPSYDFDASKATSLKRLSLANVARSVNVSKNAALQSLDISIAIGAPEWFKGHGPLRSIDVSGCPSLTSLRLDQQSLTSVDLSRNTKLTYLDVAGNNLKSIDLSKNVALENLNIVHNPLSSLDVRNCSGLKRLVCSNCDLASLDISKNAALEHLECSDNRLRSLDASNNPKLNFVYCARNHISDAAELVKRFGAPDERGRQFILPQYLEGDAPRVAGGNALGTMAAITQQGWEDGSCGSVVVATMEGYWDALTSTSLAGVKGCPVLLTDGDELSWETAYEVRRLGAETVYVSGGTAAISQNVEGQLAKVAGVKSVKRLAGPVAIDTALEVYKEGKGSWGKTAVIATSGTFQDALSASPYAFAMKAPIFLTNASTLELDARVLDAVKAGGFDRAVIVGGPAAISTKVEEQLSGIPTERLYGPTAYETSGAIAEWCLDQGMTVEQLGVATGSDYYDALAAAAFCGKNNSALVLVADHNRANIEGIIAKRSASIERLHVFGGPAAVSDATYGAIQKALA